MKNFTPAKMILVVGLAIAGMIGLFVVKRLMAVEPPPKRALTRTIPLALGDLQPGTLIKSEHIGMGPWPTEFVKDDMILSKEGLIGRIVKTPITRANPFRGRDLYAFGELPPLVVTDGYQAMTIRAANNTAILDGLIKPGNHVDIHFTLSALATDPRVTKLGGMTMTLFRGVRVLALNRDFVQAPLHTTQNSVTVEIPEKDANILLLASGKGELSLSFTRGNEGVATVAVSDADRATLEEILNLPPEPKPEPPAPPPPPPPAPTVTRVYRKSTHAVNAFDAKTNEPLGNGYNGYGSGFGYGYGGSYANGGNNDWPYGNNANGNRANNAYNGNVNPNPANTNPNYNPGAVPPGVPSTWSAPNYGPNYGPPGYGAPGAGPNSYGPGPGYAPQQYPIGPRLSRR